jgi:hypothetical protein
MSIALLFFDRSEPATQSGQANDAANDHDKQSRVLVRDVSATSDQDSGCESHNGCANEFHVCCVKWVNSSAGRKFAVLLIT